MASMPRAPREEDVSVMEAGMGPGTGTLLPLGSIPVIDASAGDYRYPPHSAQNQELRGVSNFVDGSGPIFSMYMEMATEEDRKMAENWKADADGILIFTGLFSAAVASLISVSIQDIRPNPQDTSNFYPANIYQTIADPNISTPLPSSPPPFSPPTYAIWVNSLWFMSLVISLTCALLATLLQQWARRYLKVTRSRYSPHKRARIRAFFAEGIDKYLLPWVVETLSALLHISLFLFFAGLVVFLCDVYITIFKLVLSWVGACTALYGCITFMPIFRHDSPYYTSLSSFTWFIVFGIRYAVCRVRWWFVWSVHYRHPVFSRIRSRSYRLFTQGMQRAAEETALKSRSEIDARAFMWTFDSLDENHEMERFFAGLPGFCSSKMVKNPLPTLSSDQAWKLSARLKGLLHRTFSSDLLPAPVKQRRALICAKAVDPAHTPMAFSILDKILSNDHIRTLTENGPLAADVLQIVKGWHNNTGEDTKLVAQATTSSIVARTRRHDDCWFILASNELGIPESVLRDHSREQFRLSYEFSKVLEVASDFDLQDTSSPELQHEFCALWNQIVLHVQNGNDGSMALHILRPMRNFYTALHQDIDSAPTRFSVSTAGNDPILSEPSSYPVCNIAGHIHGTVPRDIAALPPTSLSSPDAHSSSIPASPHVAESLTGVPPLDSFLPVHQTTIESPRILVTLPDPGTAGAARDTVASDITVLHCTPDTSTSTAPLSSTSPPADVSLLHNPGLLTPSNPLNHPSSASSDPILDNIILPTGPLLPSHSPTTRSDLSPSCPESHRSIIATTASAYPGPTSVPDLSTAAEGGGVPNPDLPPQPLSVPSEADSGPSQRAERHGTGGHSPHPSCLPFLTVLYASALSRAFSRSPALFRAIPRFLSAALCTARRFPALFERSAFLSLRVLPLRAALATRSRRIPNLGGPLYEVSRLTEACATGSDHPQPTDPVLVPYRAALVRGSSHSTPTRPRPPRTPIRNLAPRRGLRDTGQFSVSPFNAPINLLDVHVRYVIYP
ncbi:hypothetical protein EDB92DRAFT_1950922 [Lactarius akahatsu]|uniref:DUF6535 domain-containing protein n=1 Tax=Lactarius akahatsu TaxID=416441 RepID=A0AAD4Q9Y4_9AGAM|nr:hypothetical protein EDB92DRAFT_1950922 [Lactarius akahatsu]